MGLRPAKHLHPIHLAEEEGVGERVGVTSGAAAVLTRRQRSGDTSGSTRANATRDDGRAHHGRMRAGNGSGNLARRGSEWHRTSPGKMVRDGRGERLQAQKATQAYPAPRTHKPYTDDTTRVAQHDVQWADTNTPGMVPMCTRQARRTHLVSSKALQLAVLPVATEHDGGRAARE